MIEQLGWRVAAITLPAHLQRCNLQVCTCFARPPAQAGGGSCDGNELSDSGRRLADQRLAVLAEPVVLQQVVDAVARQSALDRRSQFLRLRRSLCQRQDIERDALDVNVRIGTRRSLGRPVGPPRRDAPDASARCHAVPASRRCMGSNGLSARAWSDATIAAFESPDCECGKHVPPRSGVGSPALWGTRDHIAALFETGSSGIATETRQFTFS